MRLAISNIAWLPGEAADVLALLTELGVPGLEIAPGLFFPDEPDPFVPSETALKQRMREVEQAGLSLISMQSLLFGANGAALFGSFEERQAFSAGIDRTIVLAGRLGVPNLVVGSPRNRVIPEGMSEAAALEMATETFRRLGDQAAAHGCVLAMEPNPAVYGTNFLNTMDETYGFVTAVDHPAVTLNFDVGSLHLNGEFVDTPRMLTQMRDRISHIHVSEPQLAPVPEDATKLKALFADLRAAAWQGWVSIEMRNAASGNLANVRRSVTACLQAMEGGH